MAAGAGALRIRRVPGERHRRRQQRHRQDPRGPGLGMAACQRGMSVVFTTAAVLAHGVIEDKDEERLLSLQIQLARLNLLIIEGLGFVPLSRTGAELLFDVFSQRCDRGSILVTTNLPSDDGTGVCGSERLTGALLGRLTHRVHIVEMTGEGYRLRFRRQKAAAEGADQPDDTQPTSAPI